jgi:hypothetical protein
VTTFDVPGAGTIPDQFPNQGTAPLGINPEGVIMGFYIDKMAYITAFFCLEAAFAWVKIKWT